MKFNSLDYIIIAVLLLSALTGLKKGFIAAVFGVISTLAGIGMAFLYRDQMAAYVQQHFGLVSSLAGVLEKRFPIAAWVSNQPILSPFSGLSGGLAYIHGQFMDLSYLLVGAICFLLIYMISSSSIKFVGVIFEKMFHWAMLGGMNRVAGAGIVMFKNIIIMAVLTGVFYYPLGLGTKMGINLASQAAVLIRESVLVPYLLQIFVFMQGLIAGSV
jgi:hypothetical protein